MVMPQIGRKNRSWFARRRSPSERLGGRRLSRAGCLVLACRPSRHCAWAYLLTLLVAGCARLQSPPLNELPRNGAQYPLSNPDFFWGQLVDVVDD